MPIFIRIDVCEDVESGNGVVIAVRLENDKLHVVQQCLSILLVHASGRASCCLWTQRVSGKQGSLPRSAPWVLRWALLCAGVVV